MKKICSFILIILSMTLASAQKAGNDYEIIGIYKTSGVTIDGAPVKESDTFSKKSTINWGNNEEAVIEVKEIATSNIYTFSKRQFDSKGGMIKNAEEYFYRTNKTSTRETGDEAFLTIKRCSDRFAFKERRIALVIGNTTYTKLPSLQNPLRDALAVTDKLLSLGFDVVETFDCNIAEFRSVLNQFEQIADGYQIVLFYYAGHGIQKDGKNYLVPVTEMLQKPTDIDNCVDCEDILRSLERTTCRSRIVIFDACRNFNSALSDKSHKGLTQMHQLAPGTMVVFSTGFGQVASDGDGNHSPFAQALLSNIGQPETSFEMEIKNVANETFRLTSNRQYPAITGSLTETVVLNPRTKSAKPIPENTNAPSNEKAKLLVDQGKRICKVVGQEDKAFPYFQEAANMGDIEGCYQLGLLYYNDNFSNANIDNAIFWLTKAANMGYSEAMFELGEIYQGRDNAMAKQWFRKAIEKGHPKAANRLSKMR